VQSQVELNETALEHRDALSDAHLKLANKVLGVMDRLQVTDGYVHEAQNAVIAMDARLDELEALIATLQTVEEVADTVVETSVEVPVAPVTNDASMSSTSLTVIIVGVAMFSALGGWLSKLLMTR